jgi:hypothetical protein
MALEEWVMLIVPIIKYVTCPLLPISCRLAYLVSAGTTGDRVTRDTGTGSERDRDWEGFTCSCPKSCNCNSDRKSEDKVNHPYQSPTVTISPQTHA